MAVTGPIGSSASGGYIYPSNFIGPIRPQDRRVGTTPSSGYGPTHQIQGPPKGSVLGAQAPQGGGGGGDSRLDALAKANRNPSQESEYQSLLQAQPQQPQIDFDALIRPALEGLDAAIAPLQQQFADFQTGAQERESTQLAQTRQNIGAQEQTLEGGRTRQNQLGESAIDEARRQFAEIQQGLQARYGGTTGTGAFAGELAGRETLGNVADIRQNLSNAMLEIDNKLQQVKEIGRISEQEIQENTQQQIRDAKSQLDLALADIRNQKGQLQARKAELAANAIQWYQGEVNRVNQQNAQFLQDMYVRQTEAEQALALKMQGARQAAESFQTYNLSKGGQNTPVRIGNRGTALDFQGNPIQVAPGSTLYNVGAYPNQSQEEDELLNPFG